MTITSLRRKGALAIAATFLFAATTVPARAADATHAQLAPLVDGMYPSLDSLYKELHAHPEIASRKPGPRHGWPTRCASSDSR